MFVCIYICMYIYIIYIYELLPEGHQFFGGGSWGAGGHRYLSLFFFSKLVPLYLLGLVFLKFRSV